MHDSVPRFIPDRGVRSTWRTVVVDTEPCGKCGCIFVSVVTPKYWPIDSVALCCALCGSVVDYVDNLLLITVKQAIRERVNRQFAISGKGHGMSHEKIEDRSYGLVREMILFGLENGLSKQDVAEALEVSEEYVSLIGGK